MLKVCLTGNGYTEQHISALSSKGFEVIQRSEHLSPDDLKALLPQYDAYVLGGDEILTEDVLKNASKLRLVSFVGTGYTSFIDEAAAKKNNIAISNTPAVMAPAVAEHTIGMLIGLQRNLFKANWQAKNSCADIGYSQELSSICIGIIGLGEIGTRIARILKHGFGSHAIYHSRTQKKHIEAELGISFVTMNDLFANADAIIFALPTNPDTEYFVNDSLLAKTKKGVILINTAGARLIEPTALKKYLDNDHIQAAAMDGYYIEPLPPVVDDPYGLLSLPDSKFVVTPHIAAKTKQCWARMIDMAINNVIHHFND